MTKLTVDFITYKMSVKKDKKRKMEAKWTEAQEIKVIELWKCRLVDLHGQKRNSHIFAEMAATLSKNGYEFSVKEVRLKIHNLTNRYRREKRKIRSLGGSPSEWKLYNTVHSIIGALKVNKYAHLVEESITEPYDIVSVSESALTPPTDSSNSSDIELCDEAIPIPGKKKKTAFTAFQRAILKELKITNKKMATELERIKDVDEKFIQLETRMVEAQEARNELLKELLRRE